MFRRPPRSTRTDTLFPYTTLFRSDCALLAQLRDEPGILVGNTVQAQTRSGVRRHTGNIVCGFYGERNAIQRIAPAVDALASVPRRPARVLAGQMNIRMDKGIDLVFAADTGVHDIYRRQPTLADGHGGLSDRVVP